MELKSPRRKSWKTNSRSQSNLLGSQYKLVDTIPEKSPNYRSSIDSNTQELANVFQEKQRLEEALRQEMQTSEEQRSYIEVLKQLLETRLTQLNVPKYQQNEFTDFVQYKQHSQKMNSKLNCLTESVKDKQYQMEQLNQDYLTEKANSTELKEQKINLEQLLQNQKKINSELTKKCEELQKQKEGLTSYVNDLEEQLKTKELEIVNLAARNKENGLRLDIKSNESNLLLESKESLEKQLVAQRKEVERLSKFENDYYITQQQVEQSNYINNDLRDKILLLQEKNNALQDNLSLAQFKCGDQEKKLRQVENLNLDLQQQIDNLLSELKAAQKQVLDQNGTFQQKSEQYSNILQQLKDLQQKYAYETENNRYQEERQSTKIVELEKELRNYKDLYYHADEKLGKFQEELRENHSTINKLQLEIEAHCRNYYISDRRRVEFSNY